MLKSHFLVVAFDLDQAGLLWNPEIGDEISNRTDLTKVSILFDPQGSTPTELRQTYVWLPTVEQIVTQLEARQALIYHAGINQTLLYETVVRTMGGVFSASASDLRSAFGLVLKQVLSGIETAPVH